MYSPCSVEDDVLPFPVIPTTPPVIQRQDETSVSLPTIRGFPYRRIPLFPCYCSAF